MRKNKDGYVLIYVVFVIIFLCIVAVGTCTVALNNIRVQTAYIEQLQDRYKAEGAIEKFMAEVCVECKALAGSGYQDRDIAIDAAKNAINNKILERAGDEIDLSPIKWEADNSQCIVTATKSVGSSRAVAMIAFSVSIVDTEYDKVIGKDDEGNDIKELRYKYHIAGATSKYLSYNLESTGGDAE